MKKLIFLLVLVSTLQAIAQDVIVKTDGSTILSKVLEVNTNDIKYKKHSNPKGPTYTINKSEVMSINYENGDRDSFASQNDNNQTKKDNGGNLSENTRIANESFINRCNSITPIWLKQQKEKKAKHTFNIMKLDENSIIENDDIKQVITFGLGYSEIKHWGELLDNKDEKKNIDYCYHNYVLIMKITNKTDKTIYIDLGNTFIVRGDEAQPYFIPSATESSTVSSSGVGVNLGAVTNALGIGGSVGALANGVNVSSGNAVGEKTIEFSQRVIAIPPLSSKTLEPQLLFIGGGKGIPYTEVKNDSDKEYLRIRAKSNYRDLQVGDIIHWNKDDPMVKLSFHLAYSFDETCNEIHRMSIGLYTSETYGISTSKMGHAVIDDLKDWQNAPFRFFIKNDPSKGLDVQSLNIEHTGL